MLRKIIEYIQSNLNYASFHLSNCKRSIVRYIDFPPFPSAWKRISDSMRASIDSNYLVTLFKSNDNSIPG